MSEKLSDLTHKSAEAEAEALFSISRLELKNQKRNHKFRKDPVNDSTRNKKINSPRLKNSEFTF